MSTWCKQWSDIIDMHPSYTEVNWGSSAQAMTFKNALNSVQSLVNVQDHVKNFRPLVLVLSGRPSSRPTLVDFTQLIAKGNGMLVCGHIIQVNNPQSIIKACCRQICQAQTSLSSSYLMSMYSVSFFSISRFVTSIGAPALQSSGLSARASIWLVVCPES